jgi:transposase-like protein
MPKRQISHNEVLDYLKNLPYSQFKNVVEHYTTHNKADFQKEMDNMITLNFQSRLESLDVNSSCPKCSSKSIKKNGNKQNIQMFKCKDCNTQFNLFTDTILEKTKWHWDIWINVLHMTLNYYSLHQMINVLEKDYGCDGINYKTVWSWRMKLINAISQMPMPKLSGIVQIDETFIRESQKGSRELISYIGNEIDRKPHYGRIPSKYGVVGAEFATITTAIDNTGHCVCKVVGLGKMSKEVFMDFFEDYLDNPSYICSDANPLYRDYCNLKSIIHYERPSNYLTLIRKAGYDTPDYANPIEAKLTEASNQKILSKLYYEEITDKITNKGDLSYEEFSILKKANKLSLAKVNELHLDIKKFIYGEMTNVSTKYLSDYIGFFTYLKNYKVDNGFYPSSKKDAELIFIEILKTKINLTTNDIKEKELDLPKPSSRYTTVLKQKTEEARKATSNEYFKFDEEDGFKTFNMRDYLSDKPKYKLHELCKELGLTKYRKLAQWSLVSLLLKQPNINETVYKLLLEDRHYKVADEDLEAIKDGKYRRY